MEAALRRAAAVSAFRKETAADQTPQERRQAMGMEWARSGPSLQASQQALGMPEPLARFEVVLLEAVLEARVRASRYARTDHVAQDRRQRQIRVSLIADPQPAEELAAGGHSVHPRETAVDSANQLTCPRSTLQARSRPPELDRTRQLTRDLSPRHPPCRALFPTGASSSPQEQQTRRQCQSILRHQKRLGLALPQPHPGARERGGQVALCSGHQ